MKKEISPGTMWMALLALMISLLAGCGEHSAGKTTITIPINFSPTQSNNLIPTRQPTTMEIRIVKVEYDEVIVQELFDVSPDDFSEGMMTMTFEDIPVEEDLLIEVSISDENGELLFEGIETIYIDSGEIGGVIVYMRHLEIGEPPFPE